jgi:dihydroorotase
MAQYLIKNITLVNEGKKWVSDVLINEGIIAKIAPAIEVKGAVTEIDGTGKYLLPGVIDDQVHFREPGLTHKASIYTEAKAAVAGGVTSFMEMPNTVPPVFTQELLEQKYEIAKNHALANYSFFMGTSNDNLEEVLKTNDRKRDVCGIKIFMGSSTGGLLVDNYLTLNKIFGEAEVLIATHCEDEKIIKANLARIQSEKELEASDHPVIRSVEACFESSFTAVQLAKQNDTRLHILHISTAKELQLFSNMVPLKDKRITNEVCVHHLHFTADDYAALGNRIKCNPAIKSPENKEALWEALLDDRLDVIATDHAPHLLSEKGYERRNGELVEVSKDYTHAHAGLPLVQHSLLMMLEYVKKGRISIEKVVEKMSHAVAVCFQIENRGFIREGCFADLVIVDLQHETEVNEAGLLYKCAWSPLEGTRFSSTIEKTFVNGHLVYGNGVWDESLKGARLQFNRP